LTNKSFSDRDAQLSKINNGKVTHKKTNPAYDASINRNYVPCNNVGLILI